jgi:FkbM family methyltransferase
MKKILLDCGSHFGQSVDKFRAELSDIAEYEIVMFEPNPYLFDKLVRNAKYNDCAKNKVAVSNKEGREILWGCTRNKENWGSTLEKSKADWDKIKSTDYVVVQTIDLSDFILKNFSNSDHIILKLDVEGSEYVVLEKMLESGAIAYINKLYCEWHSKWLAPEFKEREVKLIEKLMAAGITPEYWG